MKKFVTSYHFLALGELLFLAYKQKIDNCSMESQNTHFTNLEEVILSMIKNTIRPTVK